MNGLILRLWAVGVGLTAMLSAHDRPHHDVPPWQQPTAWPDRIITTPTRDAARGFAVTWRTDHSVGAAIAQIVPARSDARFDLNANTHRAITTPLNLQEMVYAGHVIPVVENAGLADVHFHAVTFAKLKPDTLYAYRVRGAPGKWSAWRQLRTAPETAPVQFVFFGDAQTGIRSHVTRIFDTAAHVAPQARFAIHGGDLVNTAMYDQEWAEWFTALGRTHAVIPAIPVAGNHDYVNYAKETEDLDDTKLFMMTDKGVSPMWRPQFVLPVASELPAGLHETVYDIRYSEDLHIFVLDSSGNAFPEQVEWLGQHLARSDARWKIVTMHHPLFSFVGGTEHPSHRARRDVMLAALRQHDIDLVLTGHRHTYQRGAYGDDVAQWGVGTPHDVKTMFVVTASSTKRGETKTEGWDRYSDDQAGAFKLDRHADNTPIFGVFDVTTDSLRYRAYDAVGELYDGFTVTKDAAGVKSVTNDPVAASPVKDYDNTGRYIGWDDLR